MEPFAIQCTTCRARLTVGDPALVGQILACPKCGSMVLVEASAATTGAPTERGPAPTSVSSQTIVRPRGTTPRDSAGLSDTLTDTFEDLDGVLAGHHDAVAPSPPPAAPADASRPSSTAFAEPPRHESSLPRPAEPRTTAAGSPESVGGPPPFSNSDGGIDLEGSPPKPGTKRWSPLLIVVTGGVLGVVLAVTVSVGLIAWMGRRSEVASAPESAQGDGGQEGARDSEKSTSTESRPDQPNAPSDDKSEEGGEGSLERPSRPTRADDGSDKPRDDTVSEGERPTPSSGDSPSSQPDSPPKGDGSTGKTTTDNPLDLTPKPAEKGPARSRVGGVFADLLNGGIPSAPGPDAAAVDSPPDPKPREPRVPAEDRPVLPRPLAREVDVEARLQDRLGSATYREVALADFVQELADLSTIPISLDLDRLRLRKIFASTPVAAQVEQATIEQLLRAVLEPRKLSWTAVDSQLVIGLPNLASARSRVTLPVEDLAATDELTALVSEFVASDLWGGGDEGAALSLEKDQLVIEGPEAAQLEVAAFLERMRSARKLKQKSPMLLGESYSAPDAVGRRGAAALAKTLRLNFARPTRLTTILQRLGKDSGIRIVPHWESLATVGWTLETQATVTVDGKTLAETLTVLLEPMDLTYRVVDDETIEVLAPSAASAKLQVEFHSTKGIQDDPERLVRRIESELGESQFRSAGGRGLVRYDRASDCLIALLPDAAQRTLNQRLSSWRASVKDAQKDAATPDR